MGGASGTDKYQWQEEDGPRSRTLQPVLGEGYEPGLQRVQSQCRDAGSLGAIWCLTSVDPYKAAIKYPPLNLGLFREPPLGALTERMKLQKLIFFIPQDSSNL